MPGPSSPGTVYPIPLSDVGCTYATNEAPAPQPQPQTMVRGDTDMDAAAALLGFRTVAEHEQDSSGLHGSSAMSSAAPAAASDQSRQEVLEAHLPPKKRRGQKSLGRALPLNQRPVPTTLLLAQAGLQASPPAAALAPAPVLAAAARPKISRFPERLMEMLSDETITDSICWLPHGRSFLVVNPTKFTHEVQPEYFGACKFASFTRKLYRWGFRQISKGPDAESYFHRLFRRDEPDLCEDMICKEEIRDGCPELHEGINDYTLMRMEQADRLQELMKKNLDTKKKLDIARVVKLREQQKAAAAAAATDPRQVHFQAPRVPVQRPRMATAATVDLTGSLSPPLPGAAPPQLAGVAGRSNLPGGGGIGLVQRHLLRIEKRRTELQAALQDEIIKRKSIADTKRRYTQLLAEQEEQYRRLLLQEQQQQQQQQQLYSEEPPRPDRIDTVADSKRRYAELLARQGRLSAGLTPTVQAQMQASPGMAPAHTVPTIHHQLLPGQNQTKVAGTFYPSLPKHHYQEPSTDHLKSCLKKSSSYSAPSSLAPPSFSSHSLLLAKQQQQQQHAAKLLSQHYPDHAVAALHHPSPQSAHALAILRASLEQQHKGGLSSHTPAAPGKSNVVAAGVINRALDTLHREGFA